MLAIEVDGSSHDVVEVQLYDERRQKRLESLGVRFLRFDDLDVKKNIDDVVMTIQLWIEGHQEDLMGRLPTPSPSKEGNDCEN